MTENDLWQRVAKDASAKRYKALALDLVRKATRRHDCAVEKGLALHLRIETAEQGSPDIGHRIKAAYETGLAREAFAREREGLEILLQAAFERLKEAADLIAERARSVAAAIRARPVTLAPAADPPPSPRGPSL
jgi:hypothetical protein